MDVSGSWRQSYMQLTCHMCVSRVRGCTRKLLCNAAAAAASLCRCTSVRWVGQLLARTRRAGFRAGAGVARSGCVTRFDLKPRAALCFGSDGARGTAVAFAGWVSAVHAYHERTRRVRRLFLDPRGREGATPREWVQTRRRHRQVGFQSEISAINKDLYLN